jgi:hypothetical protein
MKIPFNKIVEVSYALLGRNPNSQFKHFSFIIGKGGRIETIGMNNQNRTHPLAKKFNKYSDAVHSEMAVWLRHGELDCSNYILVNSRINRENRLVCSFPCRACSMFLSKQANFREVWATDNNGQFVRWPVI